MIACLICAAEFDSDTDYRGQRINGSRRRYCSHTCRRAAHNARYRATPSTVDDIAVERACNGDRTVHLNRAEMAEAFRLLHARGLSAAVIADRLGVTKRSAQRHSPGRVAPTPPAPARKESPAMPAPAWSVNVLTAAKVRRYATDPDDEQRLLDILGIVDERGDVLPDDTRNYDVEGNAPDSGSTIGWRKVAPEPRTDRRHVPPGLQEAS